MTTAMLPDAAQVHVDGLGLNDRIRIYADGRDMNHGGNASHRYVVVMVLEGFDPTAPGFSWPSAPEYSDVDDLYADGFSIVADIQFQHGPRAEAGSEGGITGAVLTAILLDRLRGFQAGPFSCRENALQITKLEEALHWTESRARVRRRQGVLGKNLTHMAPE